MKIQGTLTCEGVHLHVHVDAPDNVRNVYITNIPPDAMIFTRDRIRVESLPFSARVVASLHEKGIFFLNRLLTPDWKPITRGLDEEEKQEILPILERFLDAALIPFARHRARIETLAEGIDELQEKINTMQQRFHENGTVTPSPTLLQNKDSLPSDAHDSDITLKDGRDEDIRILGLPAGVTKELREQFDIFDIKDICDALLMRREELAHGRYIGEKMLARIEAQLADKGIAWKKEEDSNVS